MKWIPLPYMLFVVEHIMKNPEAGLFLGMGLRKTSITLTAIDRLIYEDAAFDKVLVIAPKRVTELTWKDEINKWDHLKHLKISLVTGTESQRRKALQQPADIYACSRDNVKWLVGYYGLAWPFKMLVIDELSSFKNPNAGRFKELRQIRPLIDRVVGLTGTPSPNGLQDLWSQMFLLDQGKRLGTSLTKFQSQFFYEEYGPGKRLRLLSDPENDPKGVNPGNNKFARVIYDRIGDICISMKEEDYLQLPERLDQDVIIKLPALIREQYEEFERDQVLNLVGEDGHITATNRAVLTGKLLQFANGAVYRADKTYYEVHDQKIDALREDLEAANGDPFLLFYQFRHDVDRIMHKLKVFNPELLGAKGWLDKWNAGGTQLLITHSFSAGHGLNMQAGGHLTGWFGTGHSAEGYQQGCKRVHRSGQMHTVVNRRYLTENTLDEVAALSVHDKITGERALLDALNAIVKRHTS